MGNCLYCNEPAGLLKKKHRECESKFNEGKLTIKDSVVKAITAQSDFDQLQKDLERISRSSFIQSSELTTLMVDGWSEALNLYLDDDLLSEEEEERLMAFQKHFALTQDDLERKGAFSRTVKAAAIRDLTNGEVPTRMEMPEQLPFNLQKSETMVWLFANTDYLEERVKREIVGRSQGVSVRIAKGVYYRTGAFKGTPVETAYTAHVDNGILGVSTKHIYFTGPRKGLRIPFSKIVTINPYEDGIGIHRDASSAKPQIFRTGDGWFTYNLVMNLSRM